VIYVVLDRVQAQLRRWIRPTLKAAE